MNKKLLSIFISVALLFSMVSIFYIETVKAAPETFTVWLSSDAHTSYDNSDPGACTDYMWDAVNDTNAMGGVDYAFHVGDMIQGLGESESFEEQWNMWYYLVEDLLNCRIYRNESIGNHDKDDLTYCRIPDYLKSAPYYSNFTYELGNILIIFVGGYNPTGDWYTLTRPWVADLIDQAAIDEQSVWIFSHYPIYDTTWRSKPVYGAGHYFTDYANWIPILTDNISLFATGHIHGPHSANTGADIDSMHITKYGFTHFNVASPSHHGGQATSDTETWFLTLTEGSTTIDCGSYNHTQDVWNPSFNWSFDLKYPFEPAEGDTTIPQFISIDGQENETTIYDSTPAINWSVVNNTSQYWLQIDNNEDFSSPEINLTDINQYNYPANCEINATRVSFTLPNALPSYNNYYMRVKAYVKT